MTVALRTTGRLEREATRRDKAVDSLLAELTAVERDGRPLDDLDRVASIRKLCEAGLIHSLEPLLPLMFNLNGAPYSLQDYFPFSPVFRTRMPDNLVLITGRQVSKSTSLASHGIAVSNSIPHFSTLFVTPRYEQIRRFSTEYVRPLIDQSPVRDLWTGSTTVNSVLQRSFKNGSKMFFSFALLDADRVRGISAKKVAIDESVRYGTLVCTPIGDIPIEQLQPGDQIHAVDDQGRICLDEVVTNSDHGVRDCYRLTLDDGSWLECTSDSFIGTTAGWRRLSTLVEGLVADAGPDASGDDAGRREHGLSQQEPEVRQSPRLLPARVQHGEVPGLVRVRLETTREGEELRLRRMVESLVHADLSRVSSYRILVPPRGQEAGNPALARRADLGGDRLVVSGRRRAVWSDGPLQHAGIPGGGSQPPGFLADAVRCRGQGGADQESPRREVLLGRPTYDGIDVSPRGEGPSLDRVVNAVQDRPRTARGGPDLSLVRDRLLAAESPGDLRGDQGQALLRERGVPAVAGPGKCAETLRRSGQPRGEEREEADRLCQRPRGIAGEGPGDCCGAANHQSAVVQGRQGQVSGQEAGSAGSAVVDLRSVQEGRTAGRPGQSDEVLRGVQADRRRREQGQVCGEAAIVRIEWTGKHPVRDIATRNHRTFFAAGICVHNCQDMDPAHVPIIRETMSASKEYGILQVTGTPKTLDNFIHGEWKRSTQSEWFTPCFACGEWSIASLEYHLEAMMGPARDDISEANPATICHACRRSINPRYGRWVHRYPDRRWQRLGLHIPQVIMPLHYAISKKWSELLQKRDGAANTAPHVFINEVLGESSATGNQLVTLLDLQAAAILDWENNPLEPSPRVFERLETYRTTVLAIDWGGGGEEGVSFTVLALLGFRSDGQIDVLWGRRLLNPHEHIREAETIMGYYKAFRPTFVAHDYTGAGILRETFMAQAGVPLEQIVPIRLVRSASQSLMQHHPPTAQHQRSWYSLDKTRCLIYVTSSIKLKLLRFFKYDYKSDNVPGLLHDFLALIDEKRSGTYAGDIYLIKRADGFTDDFAQAVNLGCATLWHANDAWPNFTIDSEYRLTPQQVRRAGNAEHGWTRDDEDHGYFRTP